MNIPSALMVAIPPAAELLLDRARRQVDYGMLTEMATADYGFKADEIFGELRHIRDTGIIPASMPGQLAEILSLTRWSNPEAPNARPFEPGPTARRGHQIRQFACAVLLRAAAEPANQNIDCADGSTLAQCLVSAKVLGEEMSEAAARFLTWRIPHMTGCSEPLLFALGLLILAIRLRSGRIDEPLLGNMAEWVLAEELHARQAFSSNSADPAPTAFSVRYGLWQPLAAELLSDAEAIRTDDVRTNIQLCSLLLQPD